MGILDEYPALKVALRVLQMIVVALLVGVLVFLAVATFLTLRRTTPPTEPATLTWVLMGFALVSVVVLAYVAAAILKRARRDLAAGREPPTPAGLPPGVAEAGDAGRLFSAYQVATILRAASYEGGALLCIVAAFVEGHTAGLVGGAAMAVLLALQIPTPRKLEEHLQAELAEVEALR